MMRKEDNIWENSMPKFSIKRMIGYLIIVAVLFGITVGIISQARTIYEESKGTRLERNLDYILVSNYNLFEEVLKERTGQKDLGEDVFFENLTQDEYGNYYIVDDGGYSYYFDRDDFSRQMRTLSHVMSIGGIDYAIRDNQAGSGKVISNSKLAKEALKTTRFPAKSDKEYKLFLLLSFDKEGNCSIQRVSGVDEESVRSRMDGVMLLSSAKRENPSAIKNVTVSLLVTQDGIDEINNSLSSDYYFYVGGLLEGGFAVIAVEGFLAVAILAFIMFFVPVFDLRNGLISRLPIEFCILAGVFCVLVPSLSVEFTAMYLEGRIANMVLDSRMTPSVIHQLRHLDSVLCYGAWFGYLLVVFVILVSLLQVFPKGIKRFLKENSIIIRFGEWGIQIIRKCFAAVTSLDMKDPINRTTALVVGLNFVAVGIMSKVFGFGWGALMLYSICLFLFLRKYLMDLKDQYQTILDATGEIANGNFDVDIKEDLGVFNPLKRELMKVREGFGSAVEEEVKSRNLRTELITNVSHDLKTPLTAIITYTNLLKDENLTPEQRRQYVDTLDRKSLRLKQLIEDLFEVSKLNSDNIQLDLVKINLVELIKQVHEEFDDRFEEAQLGYRMNVDQEPVYVLLDGQKTYRIFENLFGNAIKYAMPNTRVYLNVTADEVSVQVTIRNISATELNMTGEELIQRTARGDEARNTEGSGLGLAIVQSLVEKQGGKFHVEVEGDLFKGIIEFPRIQEDDNVPMIVSVEDIEIE